jgi:hypothetical protein
LSARGTSTLLNNALLSAHFRIADKPLGLPTNHSEPRGRWLTRSPFLGKTVLIARAAGDAEGSHTVAMVN